MIYQQITQLHLNLYYIHVPGTGIFAAHLQLYGEILSEQAVQLQFLTCFITCNLWHTETCFGFGLFKSCFVGIFDANDICSLRDFWHQILICTEYARNKVKNQYKFQCFVYCKFYGCQELKLACIQTTIFTQSYRSCSNQ